MKIIPKHERGGTFDSFYTQWTPTETQQTRSSQKSEKTSKSTESSQDKGKLTEKDLFDMLKTIKGLPNDMEIIVNNLLNTFQISSLTGVNTQNLSTMFLRSMYQIEVAAQNKEKYDKAMEHAQKSGSLAEPAIALNGDLIVQKEDGSLETVDLETYHQNKDMYKVLSVSNLANLREYDPQLANKNFVFDIINNSIGYEEFQSLLDQAKLILGSNSYSETNIIDKNALQGLKYLQNKSSKDRDAILQSALDGMYEYTESDDTNVQQVQALIQFINLTLPKRAKTWAAWKLNMSDGDQAANQLITLYLSGKLKSNPVHTLDYLGTREQVLSGKKSEKDGSGSIDVPMNTPMKLLAGYGQNEVYTLSPGTISACIINTTSLPLTNKEDKPIGPNSTLQTVLEGNFSSILDQRNVSMGGNLISSTAFKGVVITDGRIRYTDYPIDMKQYSTTGAIVPDLSKKTAEAKQNAEREIKQAGIDLNNSVSIRQNVNTINQIYVNNGLYPAYNSDGTTTAQWKSFGVMNAMANNHVLGMGDIDDNPLLKEITDDATIDNLIEITKDETYDKNDSWIFEGSYDRAYTGTIWIPIINDYHSASTGTSQKGNEALAIDTAQQVRNQINNYKQGRQPQ